MKFFGLLLFFMGISLAVVAQGTYSRVKIPLNSNVTIQQLMDLGLETDHGHYQKDRWFISDLSSGDIEMLAANKIPHEIQIADVTKFYIERNNGALSKGEGTVANRAGSCKSTLQGYETPKGFNYGSMGGFFTYDEALAKLDSLAILFPAIVSTRKPIGNYVTTEGNSIYWLKISDNPNADEDEPQILYDALHHAREPLSLSQLIYYMYYLCENYQTDPEVKALVDQIEQYFVPIVNPDGYQYNYQNSPNGGGLWRKNRRVIGDGNFGVDLNRNYGKGWGANNSGSSPNASSDVYRGPSTFSEPETQAIREFCNGHKFKFAMNYHTYSNLLVYPWGYLSKNCEDSVAFREIAGELSKYNYYKYGTDLETVGYSTNGGSDDWMYGEVATKPLIFAMTPEVGTIQDGFWPSIDRILPLCGEANYMNLTVAKLLLQYAQIEPQTPRLTDRTNGHIRYQIRRLGLETPAEFTVSLVPIGAKVSSVGSSKIYGLLPFVEPTLDSISYTLESSVPNNTEIKFQLKLSNNQFTSIDTISIVYGKIQNILTDPCENLANWSSGGWSLDNSSAYKGKSSFAENASGKYPANFEVELTNAVPFDLSNAERAEMTFRARWEMENSYDYVKLEGSDDAGLSWQNICAPHNQVTANSQLNNQEVYTGVTSDWVYEIVNLDDFIGKKLLLRWTFKSDNGLQLQGFNLDDILINKLVKPNVGVDLTALSPFSLAPNPVSTTLLIQSSLVLDEKIRVSVWNTSGQRVLMEELASDSGGGYVLDVADLPVGLYFIEIATAQYSGVQKVQIQR